MVAWTEDFLARLRPLLIENWSAELQRLSFPTSWATLTARETRFLAFGPRILHSLPAPDDSPELALLLAKADTLMSSFPGGSFVRLSTGSAKDSPVHFALGGRFRRPMSVVKALQGSARLQRHLRGMMALGAAPKLIARRWTRIPRWSEFRLFVIDGSLRGVSQLHVERRYPSLLHNVRQIEDLTRRFADELCTLVPARDFAADVCLRGRRSGGGGFRPVLIELNPGGPETDGLLFDRTKSGDFDGTLRFVT